MFFIGDNYSEAGRREWQSPQGEIKYFNSIQGWRIDARRINSSNRINRFSIKFSLIWALEASPQHAKQA